MLLNLHWEYTPLFCGVHETMMVMYVEWRLHVYTNNNICAITPLVFLPLSIILLRPQYGDKNRKSALIYPFTPWFVA